MGTVVLKISVLGNGSLLLDGAPATLPELESAMDAATKEQSVVWYYRENGGSEPPRITAEVMKMITERRLPVRLSTKPDFSDSVQRQGTAEVFDQIFAKIREFATQRKLVILRPDGGQLSLPALTRESMRPEQIAAMEKILPSSIQRRIAVLAETRWALTAQPSIQEAGKAIPFFGMLMGFAAIGHAVWIFDPSTAEVLAAGCLEAHVVIVDGDKLIKLPQNWRSLATTGERKPQILVHDRATYQLRKA